MAHTTQPAHTGLAPRKRPSQSRSAHTVDAILDATARILVERGYAGTSTNAVAERAGVSVGSLYQYFPNKDALIAALHTRHIERMKAVIEAALARAMDTNLDDGLAGLIEGAVEAHRVEADLHRVLDQQMTGLGVVDAHDQFDAVLEDRIVALLQRHRDAITVADLRLAAYMLNHSTHALIHTVVAQRPRGVTLAAAGAEIVRMMRAYLTAPADAS
ncbi:MAG: TetR family transcriptional regulator [Proteobacteria bacterium]|nr:TetR family transcriptional regulator [Pseudomonadota bacterium]